jgi:hypothetical protein
MADIGLRATDLEITSILLIAEVPGQTEIAPMTTLRASENPRRPMRCGLA